MRKAWHATSKIKWMRWRTKVPDLLELAAAETACVVLVGAGVVLGSVIPADQLLTDVPRQLCTVVHTLAPSLPLSQPPLHATSHGLRP